MFLYTLKEEDVGSNSEWYSTVPEAIFGSLALLIKFEKKRHLVDYEKSTYHTISVPEWPSTIS